MTYTIAIQEEAIIEMQEAFEWYENKRNGLGYELLDKIEGCFLKISNTPTHYTHINETYRRIKTQKFPYLIIYEIEESFAFIVAIRHAKQRPIK
jgi:toxin ParE1/3/4